MKHFVWLSTMTSLRVCHSLANACHLGTPGDCIYQQCSQCERCLAGNRCMGMAGRPSHRIVASRTGKKRAVRIIYPSLTSTR